MADVTPQDEAAAAIDAARDGLRSLTAARNGGHEASEVHLREPADSNRYARDKRVQFNHRLFESFARDFAAWSDELERRGWPVSQVSQNELLMACLDAIMPHTAEEAEALIRRWGTVKSSPPPPQRPS